MIFIFFLLSRHCSYDSAVAIIFVFFFALFAPSQWMQFAGIRNLSVRGVSSGSAKCSVRTITKSWLRKFAIATSTLCNSNIKMFSIWNCVLFVFSYLLLRIEETNKQSDNLHECMHVSALGYPWAWVHPIVDIGLLSNDILRITGLIRWYLFQFRNKSNTNFNPLWVAFCFSDRENRINASTFCRGSPTEITRYLQSCRRYTPNDVTKKTKTTNRKNYSLHWFSIVSSTLWAPIVYKNVICIFHGTNDPIAFNSTVSSKPLSCWTHRPCMAGCGLAVLKKLETWALISSSNIITIDHDTTYMAQM